MSANSPFRRACLAAAATAALLADGAAAQPPPPPPPENGFTDIVVTARPGPLRPLRDAIDYYRDYCFDANRLSGRSAPPVDDSDWQPLDDTTRRQFGVTDPDSPAFGLVDRARQRTLLLKFERLLRPGGLIESRCTLVVIGGNEHGRLVRQMSALFHGTGTQRHVGAVDGAPSLRGWRQWLWTGMPQRGSRSWRVVAGSGPVRPGGTWVVVTDLRFYDNNDYVLGDLKIREGAGRPVSMLSFAFTTRPR
jgi:hypothetical protein